MLADIEVTEKGVFIPQDTYRDFGKIEVVRYENYILIKPKDVTRQFSGFVRPKLNIEDIHDDYESSLVTGAV